MDRQAMIQKLKTVKIPAMILGAGLGLCVVVFVVVQKKGSPAHEVEQAEAEEASHAHGKSEHEHSKELVKKEKSHDQEDEHSHDKKAGHEVTEKTAESSHHEEHDKEEHVKAEASNGLFGIYVDAFHSIQDKVDQLARAQQENDRLRLENANLRLQTEALRFNCDAKMASTSTKETEQKLEKMTGAPMGRIPASIQYRPPSHLLPPQLYTLAISYFKGHEHEKAAVIMSMLTGLKDNDAYRTPENYLIAGVAWYHVDNLELADQYFEKVLKAPSNSETLRYQAHARLWKGLIAEREHKHLKSQYWLQDLLDHHPQSTEAAWVNPAKEVKHAPQSE
jgi:hypothetical protein